MTGQALDLKWQIPDQNLESGPGASEVAFLMVLKFYYLWGTDQGDGHGYFLPEGNETKDSEVISLFDTYRLSLELILWIRYRNCKIYSFKLSSSFKINSGIVTCLFCYAPVWWENKGSVWYQPKFYQLCL